ncbi:hypothetical protein CBR_g31566 [Chara braunii]|uniref:Apple domain-containing protein n=1 Tax=Chara braunii TaxID=69332 RepID=A0A388LFB2_CHABU|nr:hypothetical protein CBR_g31566 [Chara braunii]|eukprot:GBG81010.1 hypothetical protein CBR_g31566 [Chara braunii]
MLKPSTVLAAIVALGLVLIASPVQVSGQRRYLCWYNRDQNAYTFKKIDCKKQPTAATLEGCQEVCTSHGSKCAGIVFAVYNWPAGKHCCFLKSYMDFYGRQFQMDRHTCKKE